MSNLKIGDRISAALQKHGLAPDGADWVSNACNPVSGTATGIPDGNGCRGTTPRFLTEFTIGDTSGTAYDAAILIPGGSNTAALVAYGPPGTDFHAANGYPNSVTRSACYNISSPRNWEPVVASANGQTLPSSVRKPPRDYNSFRWASRFVTAECTAADLNNGGVISACTYSGQPTNIGIVDRHLNVCNEFAYTGTLDENQFAQFAPGTYTAPAKEGVYIPIGIRTGGAAPFVRRSYLDGQAIGVLGVGAATVVGSYICDATFGFVNAETGLEVPWVIESSRGSGPQGQVTGTSDIGFDATGITVVILRNVSGPFRIRVGGVMEANPTAASDEIPYMRQAPVIDTAALEVYDRLRASFPYGFPAKYNFLGFLSGLLPKIISGITTVGRFLMPSLQRAAGGAAVDIARRAADHLTGGTPPEHAPPSVPNPPSIQSQRSTKRVLAPSKGRPLPGK